ncbi:MAG: TetR family transcriptional regulator [candidate division KSB1 bacterium]|nr:TetR family transcriptional regulator [candidate division KSB1 bacterium]
MKPSKTEDKRQKIIQAAIKVFAKNGFYNSKISEIAKEAEVADGTIYLYFKNKDDILLSLFEEEMGKIIETIKEEIAKGQSAQEKIRNFARFHLNLVETQPELATVIQVELRQSNKFMREYPGTKFKEYLDVIASIIEEGQKAGELRSDIHPGIAKRVFFGALDEIATDWVLAKNKKYRLSQSAEQISEIFIRGIAR